jgi:hypothetical protein
MAEPTRILKNDPTEPRPIAVPPAPKKPISRPSSKPRLIPDDSLPTGIRNG